MSVSPSVTADCQATGLSYQTIPDLPTTACKDPSVSFSYTLVDSGSYLNITWGYDTGRSLIGRHFIPSSEIVWENTQIPTGAIQVYEGPTAFPITDLEAVAIL